jgi:membrane protease YdiL (CAAX protease family)
MTNPLPDAPAETTSDASPISVVPLPKPSSMFMGPDGLRSGWGFLLYLGMVVAMVFFSLRGLSKPMHALKGSVWEPLAQEALLAMVAFLPALVMARIEKRNFGAYGLPSAQAFGRRFFAGLLWGFSALTVLLCVLRVNGSFYFGSAEIHGARAAKFALFWAAVVILVGFFEEFLFRGYTLFTLTRGIGFWPSAVLLSILFGLAHAGNPGESWRGEVSVGLLGLFCCFTLLRTGTLWFAVGFHAAFDWGEIYFYGAPNSGTPATGHLLNSSFHGPAWLTGGSAGPEGSVLAYVLIGLAFLAFHLAFPAREDAPA